MFTLFLFKFEANSLSNKCNNEKSLNIWIWKYFLVFYSRRLTLFFITDATNNVFILNCTNLYSMQNWFGKKEHLTCWWHYQKTIISFICCLSMSNKWTINANVCWTLNHLQNAFLRWHLFDINRTFCSFYLHTTVTIWHIHVSVKCLSKYLLAHVMNLCCSYYHACTSECVHS